MPSSKIRKLSVGIVLALLAFAVVLQGSVPQRLLKWGLQIYLGEILHGRVTIQELRGGFFKGIHFKDVRFYSRSLPTPLLSVDEIATNFHLLGAASPKKECMLSGLRIYLQECLSTFQEFSLPLESPLVVLPRSSFWGMARCFSMTGGMVLQSALRQDNVLLGDLSGSLMPTQGQLLEFFFGTAKDSVSENRLAVYGTVHATRQSSNVDFDLKLSRIQNLNLFLRSFHVLKGNAHLEGKVRSGKLDTAGLEFQGVELFFSSDGRVLKNLQGKIATNDKFVSLRDCKFQSEGLAVDTSGDAQRIAFERGRIDISQMLAKARVLATNLSAHPIDLDIQSSTTIFYRHSGTLARLQWNKEILESLCLVAGKININKVVDLDFQAKYSPGLPFGLDYKILSLDFAKVKKDWFGDKLGSLFGDVKILGDGQAQCQWDRILLTGLMDWNDNKMQYRFVWEDRQLILEDFRVDEATTLLGKLDLDNRENSELVFHFQNENITRFVRALGQDRKTSMTGKFSGSLGFRGNPLDPAIQGELDLKNGMLKGVPFREGQIHLAGRFPMIHLDRSVLFIKKDMPVALNGFIDFSEVDVFKNVTTQMKSAQDRFLEGTT